MINSITNILDKHFDNILPIYSEIKSWEKIDQNIFEDWHKISMIDSFIFNFIKIQDLMCDKLFKITLNIICLLYTSPSPRDRTRSRMPSSA